MGPWSIEVVIGICDLTIPWLTLALHREYLMVRRDPWFRYNREAPLLGTLSFERLTAAGTVKGALFGIAQAKRINHGSAQLHGVDWWSSTR